MTNGELIGYLQARGTLEGELGLPDIAPAPEYEGPYRVRPKAYIEQVLGTNGKLMTDDVTVEEVPYTEVSNLEGTTCIIATD